MKKVSKYFVFLIVCIFTFCVVKTSYDYIHSKNEYVSNDCESGINDVFFRIEGGNTNILVKYPVICPETDEVNEKINKQIFDMVISGDLVKYKKNPNYMEILYEVTFINEQVFNVCFSGSGYFINAPLFFDKGMLFDLKTGEILGLNFFYDLEDMKCIISNAWEKGKIQVDLPVEKDWQEEIIADFVKLFETNEYISQTDNFFIKDNMMYFIVSAPQSMRGYIYIKMDIDNFPEIADKCAPLNLETGRIKEKV